jgi:predicted enzyme related to lactoylglutathione lyase
MNLASIRIITANFDSLVKFYEQVTGVSITRFTDTFGELQTKNAALAIGGTDTLQFFGGDVVAQAAQNRSAIIEFLVDDVDKDYERLADFLADAVVQKPTTMPWGNRSLLFRDPDGNLVNFFTPVSEQAVRRFEGLMNK